MKINSNTCLIGRTVVLVPYKEHHVEKYHNWMKSRELQILTASEELTMEEEFEMQRTWHQDENKCTYIVLDKLKLEAENDEIGSMIGDTNFFIIESSVKTAEVEIMIAEGAFRGKGRGLEAIMIMLRYGCEELAIKKFEAKIGLNNEPSISLFKKLGFCEVSRSEVFSEATFEKVVTHDWVEWLLAKTAHVIKVNYCPRMKSN